MAKLKSKKSKKQRKKFHAAKLHERGKQICSTLNKELRKGTMRRALPLRVGDRVKVMRGKHRKYSAKVSNINRAKRQVLLEKLTRKKSDGTDTFIPLNASNLMIVELYTEDSKRAKSKKIKIEKKKSEGKKEKTAKEEA